MKKNSIVLSLVAALVLAGCGATAPAAKLPVASLAPATTAQAVQTSYTAPAGTAQAALNAPIAVDSTIAALQNAFESIYTDVSPSVVTINVVSHASVSTYGGMFGRQSGQPTQAGLGSGFVWDTNGNIVTNNHVIDGADQITVVFADGTQAPAKLVATDSQSDLAVVHVDVPASQLKPVRMGDSAAVRVGQLSIAIGNPFGEQSTMTTGIISALGRFLPTDLNATGPTYQIPDMIQTDAPINPGNSGGVLLDIEGNVIGVTSAIESAAGSSSGIGFAIPAKVVSKVVLALISNGKYDHSYLGLSGTDLTPDLATAMNLNKTQRGALVGSVVAGGPAASAGIQGSTDTATVNGQQQPVGGDVIVAINGQQVKTFNDVVSYLELSTKVGENVTLTVLRGGKQMDVAVTLGARPATPPAASRGQSTPSQRAPYRSNPDQTNPNLPQGSVENPT